MQQIGEILRTTTPEVSGAGFKPKALEVCAVCGKPTKLELKLFGTAKTVNCLCDCEKAAREHEKQELQQIQEEWERRRNRKYSLMDEKAKAAVFEKLTVTAENVKYIRAAEQYCTDWEQNKRENNGLLFYGRTGRGKTTLACCIANRLLDMGVKVKAMSVNDMIRRVKDSFDNYGEDGKTELKSDIESADLLVLDDLGAERKTDWSAALVYEIIDARYRSCNPTIVTTNLPIAGLRDHLTDSCGVARAYDRLIEMLSPIEFKGGNFRQQLSQEKNYNFFKGAEL